MRRRIFIPMGRVTAVEADAVVLNTGTLNLRRFEKRPGELLVLENLLDRRVTIVGNDREIEQGPALSLWLARWPEPVTLEPFRLVVEETADGYSLLGWPDALIATGQIGTGCGNRCVNLVPWRSTHGPPAVNDD